MKRYKTTYLQSEKGSAMLITTILLLAMMVLVAATTSLSSMQFDLAMLNRNTSNTYYLAKSAVEKQVDTMNKAVESQLSKLMTEISSTYITSLVNQTDTVVEYNNTEHKIQVVDSKIKEDIMDKIYDYLIISYKTKVVNVPPSPIDYNGSGAKDPITYTVQSDRVESGYSTEIKIIITDKDAEGKNLTEKDPASGKLLTVPTLRVIATATTKKMDGTTYDQQTVEGIVEVKLPTNIDNQIHERYELATGVPELLNNALLCFSDVVVQDSGVLKVVGDVRVSGEQDIAVYGMNQYPEADQNGGVIAINGGKIDVDGNLYCTNNVLATNGWGKDYANQTQIDVSGDIIAYTVGIVDDYYKTSANQSPFSTSHQVSNASILGRRNIMVDNDIMIDRWVNSCGIKAIESIFGINGGTDNISTDVVDPNQSSGVFSQGSGSQIIAERMYVAGQPYVTLQEGKQPLKLWESIGEPFDGIASFEGYKTFTEDPINNSKYLLSTSPFYGMIATDKIKTDFDNTYAVAQVSGVDSGDSNAEKIGRDCKAVFGNNQSSAVRFFYQGGSSKDFSRFMKNTGGTYNAYVADVQEKMTNLTEYYEANKDGFFKNISNNLPASNFRGLRGYMTLMRSVFYDGFTEGGVPNKIKFENAVKKDILPSTSTESNMNSWSYETPICVTKGGEIDISKFYVDEGIGAYNPYPTIIINRGGQLTIKASRGDRNTFKGIIISESAIEMQGDLTVEGTVIIGGPESMPNPQSETETSNRKAIFEGKHAGLIIKSGIVTIRNNPAVLTELVVKDQNLYRNILDALYFTNYNEKTNIKEIMDKQNKNTKPIFKYTDQSILEVNTEGIKVVLKLLKKV